MSIKNLIEVVVWQKDKDAGRAVRRVLEEYEHEGRTYVCSKRGEEFGICIMRQTSEKIGVTVSVDGRSPHTLAPASLTDRLVRLDEAEIDLTSYGGPHPFPFAFDTLVPPWRGAHPAGFKLSFGLIAVAAFLLQPNEAPLSETPDELHEIRYEPIVNLLALGIKVTPSEPSKELLAREKLEPFPGRPSVPIRRSA